MKQIKKQAIRCPLQEARCMTKWGKTTLMIINALKGIKKKKTVQLMDETKGGCKNHYLLIK